MKKYIWIGLAGIGAMFLFLTLQHKTRWEYRSVEPLDDYGFLLDHQVDGYEKEFQYATNHLDGALGQFNYLGDQLKFYGRDRWELVSASAKPGDASKMICIFKRPVWW